MQTANKFRSNLDPLRVSALLKIIEGVHIALIRILKSKRCSFSVKQKLEIMLKFEDGHETFKSAGEKYQISIIIQI